MKRSHWLVFHRHDHHLWRTKPSHRSCHRSQSRAVLPYRLYCRFEDEGITVLVCDTRSAHAFLRVVQFSDDVITEWIDFCNQIRVVCRLELKFSLAVRYRHAFSQESERVVTDRAETSLADWLEWDLLLHPWCHWVKLLLLEFGLWNRYWSVLQARYCLVQRCFRMKPDQRQYLEHLW